MIWAAWPFEFSLELCAAFFAFRRRQWILFSCVAFLAATDPIKLAVRVFAGPDAYGWADWIQYGIFHGLLCVLACQICGKLLGESWQYHAAGIAAFGALLVGFIFGHGESLPQELLGAGISASMWLCIVIWLGWISRKSNLQYPWNWITAGLLIFVISDAAGAALWMKWSGAEYLYSVGSLAALSIWALGMVRKQSTILPIALNLGARKLIVGWQIESL